jgi:hypothetical protein
MKRWKPCRMVILSLSIAGFLGLTLDGCGGGGGDNPGASSPSPTLSNDNANGATYRSNCGVVNPVTQVSDCPPNDAATLASNLVFKPSVSGTYYVRVKHSPAAPPSAGVYGSYDLKITSP